MNHQARGDGQLHTEGRRRLNFTLKTGKDVGYILKAGGYSQFHTEGRRRLF